MSDYADHTTPELVLDLEAGAAVLARDGMHDFPACLRAAAKRLEDLQAALVELAPVKKCNCKPYHTYWCPAAGEDNRLKL